MKLKKILKQIISLTAVSSMVLGMTACGESTTTGSESKDNETTQNEASVDSDEVVEFSYWCEFDPTVGNKTFDDNLFWSEFQTRTNSDIEFIHPPVGQTAEQFKLLVANPKDLPDVIHVGWSGYQGGIQQAIDDGVIVTLNDYLDVMPNLKKIFDENKEALRQCSTDNGDIYALPSLTNEKIRSYGSLIIREDILDSLGLEMPETIEEWEITFKAMQESGIEHPLGMNYTQLTNPENVTFPAGFGVNNSYFLDANGEVQYAPITEGYKEFITKMKDWYELGFFDPDFAAIDTKMIDAGVVNGEYATYFGWFNSSISNLTKAAEAVPGFELSCISNPAENKGDKIKFLCQYRTLVGSAVACVTSSCEDPAAVFAVLDNVYNPEFTTLADFGVEGTTYNLVDGKAAFSELITNNPDGLSFNQAQKKYTVGNQNQIGITNSDPMIEVVFAAEYAKQGIQIANKDVDEVSKYAMPAVSFTAEEEKQEARINTEISTYLEENLISFIIGARPIEEYDDFVEELKALGVEDLVANRVAAVERYNNR